MASQREEQIVVIRRQLAQFFDQDGRDFGRVLVVGLRGQEGDDAVLRRFGEDGGGQVAQPLFEEGAHGVDVVEGGLGEEVYVEFCRCVSREVLENGGEVTYQCRSASDTS